MCDNWDKYCLPSDADVDLINHNYNLIKQSFSNGLKEINYETSDNLKRKVDEKKPVQSMKSTMSLFGKRKDEFVVPEHPIESPIDDWTFIFKYRLYQSLDLYLQQSQQTNPSDTGVNYRVKVFKDEISMNISDVKDNYNTQTEEIIKKIMTWRNDKKNKVIHNTENPKQLWSSLINIIQINEQDPAASMMDSTFQSQYTSILSQHASNHITTSLGTDPSIQQCLRTFFTKIFHVWNQPINPNLWLNQKPGSFSHMEYQGMLLHSISMFICIYRKVIEGLYSNKQELLGSYGVDYTVTLILADVNNIFELLIQKLKEKYSFLSDPSIWLYISQIIRDNLFIQAYPVLQIPFYLFYLAQDNSFSSNIQAYSALSPRSFDVPAKLFNDMILYEFPSDSEGFTDIDKEWMYIETIFQEPIAVLKQISADISPLSRLSKLTVALFQLNDLGQSFCPDGTQLTRPQLVSLIVFCIVLSNLSSCVFHSQLLKAFIFPDMQASRYYQALSMFFEVVDSVCKQ
ncbi:hypothetical protein WA158_005254 [Blastocystis sp. Blastoise]